MSYIYIYAGNKNAKLQNERFERRPTKYISSWQVAISTCIQYLISWTACSNYFKYCITYMNLENVNILIVSKNIFAPLYMYYWSLLRILSCMFSMFNVECYKGFKWYIRIKINNIVAIYMEIALHHLYVFARKDWRILIVKKAK